LTKNILALICVIIFLVCFILAQNLGLIPYFRESSTSSSVVVLGTVNATTIEFSPWELETWLGIKERVVVRNTDARFPEGQNRILQWISMRNSTSAPWDGYYQKSMEYLCFWEGQGANGEWQAVISIYNRQNATDAFVVEVSRFTWYSLDVLVDGVVVASFPEVDEDNVESIGYVTIPIIPS
jgi:hypothetical protein